MWLFGVLLKRLGTATLVQSSSTPGHCFNFSRAKASRAQHLHSISSGLGDPTMITVKHDYFDGNHENTQYIAPTPYFSIKIVLLAAYYCYGKNWRYPTFRLQHIESVSEPGVNAKACESQIHIHISRSVNRSITQPQTHIQSVQAGG